MPNDYKSDKIKPIGVSVRLIDLSRRCLCRKTPAASAPSLIRFKN